ncbi:MAG: hypothetical protein ACXWSC_11125 [Bdellovibrionota bacterium]
MRSFYLAFLSMALLAPQAAHAEITWNAGIGVRQVFQRFDDGLGLKDSVGNDISGTRLSRREIRATFGPSAKGESVDWGIDVRTKPAGVVNSDWVTVQDGTSTAPALGAAFARVHGEFKESKWAATVGRQRTVLLYDIFGQSLFGNAVRWDGFGWTFTRGIFGANLAQYILGAANQGIPGASQFSSTDSSQSVANTQGHFGVLYGFQPFVKIPFSDDILSTLAIGYYVWNGTGGNDGSGFFSNAVHGGTPGTVGVITPFPLDNARQWHVLSDTALPLNFRFVGEYIRNKAVAYGTRVMAFSPLVNADRSAFALSLILGKPRKSGDISFQYSYTNRGIASAISAFGNVDIPADNMSHMLELKYMLADDFALAGRLQYHREKAQVGGDGQPLGIPNNGRLQQQRRIEINAQVQI